MNDTREIIAVEPYDYSLISKENKSFYCACPQKNPKNYPVMFLVDGDETDTVQFEKITTCQKNQNMDMPAIDQVRIKLEKGMQVVHLPLEDDASLPPDKYAVSLQLMNHELSIDERVELSFEVADYEIICQGHILYMGESRRFVVIVGPAAAGLYSKSGKGLLRLGFPETVVTACLCGETLVGLSMTGYLHCYDMDNLSQKTYRLTDKRQKSGVLIAEDEQSFYWHSQEGNIYKFILTHEGPQRAAMKKRRSLPENKEFTMEINNDICLTFRKEDGQYSVSKPGSVETLELEEGPPKLILVVPGDEYRKPAVWFSQGPWLTVFEWNAGSLYKKHSELFSFPSAGMRFIASYYFYANQGLFGVGKTQPQNNALQVAYPSVQDQKIVLDRYCSALNMNNLLYAVGDSNGNLNIWKPGSSLCQIQAHDVLQVMNITDNETLMSSEVTALCWLDEQHLVSAGVDQMLKCYLVTADNDTISAELIWDKTLNKVPQGMAVATEHLIVSTENQLLWLDREDGLTIFNWNSPDAILDPVAVNDAKEVICADWNGNMHFFKHGKKLRTTKISKNSIFAIQVLDEKTLFLVTENNEGLLVDMHDHDKIVTRFHFRLPCGIRNAHDIARKGDYRSLVVQEKVEDISSPAPVFCYPWHAMPIEGDILHFSFF